MIPEKIVNLNMMSYSLLNKEFDDAEYLVRQFGTEEVEESDLINLSKYTGYIKLLVDGMPTKPFSFDTFPPHEIEIEEGRKEKIIKVPRSRYSTRREIIEEKIRRWSESREKGELREESRDKEKEKVSKNKMPV